MPFLGRVGSCNREKSDSKKTVYRNEQKVIEYKTSCPPYNQM